MNSPVEPYYRAKCAVCSFVNVSKTLALSSNAECRSCGSTLRCDWEKVVDKQRMTTAKDVREVRKREDVREFRKRRGWLGATCLFLFFCGIALMVWNIDPTSLSPDEVFAAKAKMLTGQKFTNEDRIISFGVTEYDIRPTDWILRPYEAFLEGAADIAWKDGGAVSFRYVATFVYQKDVPHISGERRGTWLFQSSEEEKTSTTVHEHPALEGLADIAAAIALRKTLSGYFAE